MSVSHVLRTIIDTYADTPASAARPRKARTHVTIDAGRLMLLTRLGSSWGLTRSDTARRLIDAALADDPMMAA